MLEKSNKITQLGKSNLKMLINSVYGAIPGAIPGADSLWYHMLKRYNRIKSRKNKIKTIIND